MNFVRWAALLAAIVSFALTLALYFGFQTHVAEMQFVENVPWIPGINSNYHIGIDGISLWFVVMTAFITMLVVLASWHNIAGRLNQYMGAVLILSGLMIGTFSVLDALMFYVFFEATLVPMYLIIGIWGGPRKIYSAFKFFLYTFMGLTMLVARNPYLYTASGNSFDIQTWQNLPLGATEQTLLFIAFVVAFGVKLPMWPLHTWLPDVHVEAPTGGSAILASIMLKLGGYGFADGHAHCA